jgi:hypothetical protein
MALNLNEKLMISASENFEFGIAMAILNEFGTGKRLMELKEIIR